jgi:hypothetical protein
VRGRRQETAGCILNEYPMVPFDFRPRTRVLFGTGEFARLGEIAREFGGSRCLLRQQRYLEDICLHMN